VTDPPRDRSAVLVTGTVPLDLATQLQAAGLPWTPAEGDRFVVPDRGMDDQVFMISPMVVEVQHTPTGPVMAFNGTTEWALDTVVQGEVVWLPSEARLREALGPAFIALAPAPDGFRCTVEVSGAPVDHLQPTAAEAYGRAVLHLLLHG
jgi:hypothetical protein